MDRYSSAISPLLSSVAIGLFALSLGAAHARTFTDNRGQSVEAEITNFAAGNVILVTEHGARLTVPVNQLSGEDQKFVEEWRLKHPDIKLTFVATKKTVGDRETKRMGEVREASAKRCFEVEVKNAGFDDVADLTFKYTLYVGFNDRYASDRTGISDIKEGTAQIAHIEKLRTANFTTVPVGTVNHDSMKSTSSGSVTVKTFKKYRTDLVGIKVETYHGGALVDTYESGKTK